MSAADYAVMVPLSEAPNGQLRTKDLGIALGWDRSRTSHQVTRMVKRGLVAREFCEDDARGSTVRLTPAGKAAIEKAAPKHVALVRQLFVDPLSDDELDALGVTLDRMLAAVGLAVSTPGARRLGAAIGGALVAYSLGFCIWASVSPGLQRPDWDAVAERLGEASAPRAMVSWTLGV